MERQEREDGRAGLVTDVERLQEAVRDVEMSQGDREAALALLDDLRAILTRSETPAPRIGGVLGAQEHTERPTRPVGRGWQAGFR